MNLLNAAIKSFLQLRAKRIATIAQNPLTIQEEIFHDLIKAGSETTWGIQHNYQNIKNYNDFKRLVPIQDYESLNPLIDRTIAGEQNLLWPSDIHWFAKSSGTTTGKSKFIPVSKASLKTCHLRGGRDALVLYCAQNPNSKIFIGKGLILGGSHAANQYNKHCRVGDISAVMMQNMPLMAHALKTPRLSISLLDNWEEKLELMAETTIRENVTNISGVPTWTLVLIRRILEKTGKATLKEVWPNLELYIHGGVNFAPYKAQFQSLIGGDINYLETYNASEGFFGIQDAQQGELLLMLDYGIFYEFVPINEIDKELPEAISLQDVEIGQNYALVISTNAGLWRYMIGDTIQFTSTRPYRFHITGRTKQFINAFGEEVIIENANQAIQVACDATQATVSDYTAGPIYFETDKKGGHEWLIEFETVPKNKQTFTDELDQALQAKNSDYEAKRSSDLALQKPTVKTLPKGTFYNWLKSKGKTGGQNKVPRLSNDRKILDEIISFYS